MVFICVLNFDVSHVYVFIELPPINVVGGEDSRQGEDSLFMESGFCSCDCLEHVGNVISG